MPGDTQADTLAPKQVGAYQRVSVEEHEAEAEYEQVMYMSYEDAKGNDAISLGVFICPTAASAQKALADQDKDLAMPHREGTDPSYFREPDGPEGATFMWTRGRFYFLLQAWQGEKDLDAFMAEFPY